jgi:hypothetical protein
VRSDVVSNLDRVDQPLVPASQVKLPRIRIGAVLALALAAGATAWVLLGQAQGPPTADARADGPRLATPSGLSALAAFRDSRVYWAGRRAATVYEVTESAEGYVYVRYLPSGSSPGDRRPDFLTVATYPRAGAYADIEAAAQRPGAVSFALPRNGLAVYDRSAPTSVYLAFRGGQEQIEVYDPSADEARRLVQAGIVRPVP